LSYPYLFDLVMDVETLKVKDEALGCKMFAKDVYLTAEYIEQLTCKLED
jgi:hypothetical protein